MQVFSVAATADSFAAAARILDMSSVMVGKHVQALEQQLGARLIERTTRKQALTEIGVRYLERCRDVLASVETADRVAETLRTMPQGILRVSAPVSYGAQRLMPVIRDYASAYPQVKIDLALSNHLVDLADEHVDIAIRSGKIDDLELVARPLRAARILAVASPAYLASHGTPLHPADLAQHNCLAFGSWGGNHVWRFSQGSQTVSVPVQGGFVSNHGQALLAAALGAMGIVVQADDLLEPYLQSGQLAALMPDWHLPTRPLHIVRRSEIWPSAKVRSFVDFVAQRLG